MKTKKFKALHFELTNKCNLRCRHCYNIKYLESGQKELSISQIKMIIDKAIVAGCQDIGISGGEPFTRQDIIEILKYVNGYPIHILTNGLLITNEMIEELKDQLIEFRVSLDGLETHRLIRGVSYEKVIDRIIALLENDFVVTVNTMITNYNIKELSKMYDIMKRLNVDRWRLDFIFESGNAQTNNMVYDDVDEMLKKLKELITRYINDRPSFEFDVNKIFRSSLLDGATSLNYTSESNPCAYQGALTIRPTGDVSFCPSLDVTYGNLLEQDLDEILNNEEWIEFAGIKVKDIKGCPECDYLKYCGGGCRADAYYDQGSFYQYSPLTCRLVKFSVDEIRPLFTKND